MAKVLYYAHDPMCSWCWAFRNTWEAVQVGLPASIEVRYLVGGLAPDSDKPMPLDMQQAIRSYWQKIEDVVPGTPFNYDFWKRCEPRRSTYPSCRAVIAAKSQNKQLEQTMILAIQQAYYLLAKNPSDDAVLIECAQSIGLDVDMFEQSLNSVATQQQLLADIKFSRSIGVRSFPSLVLVQGDTRRALSIDYNDADALLTKITE